MLRKYSGYEKFTPHTECAIQCWFHKQWTNINEMNCKTQLSAREATEAGKLQTGTLFQWICIDKHHNSAMRVQLSQPLPPPPKIYFWWNTWILIDITVITFQLHLTCYWSEKLKDPDECHRRWRVTGSWYEHTTDEYRLPDLLTDTFMHYDSEFFWNASTNPCIPDKAL
jgi:hypothetical protein